MVEKIILIGESFSIIQTIIKKQIESHNCKVLTATDGEGLLKVLEENVIDIILLNPNIFMINGIECIKAIRSLSDPKKAKIPIIAITANAYKYDINQFKLMGFDNYIEKPINFELLIDMIKNIE